MLSVQDRVGGLILGIAAGDKNKGPLQMSLKLIDAFLSLNGEYNSGFAILNYMKWYFGRGIGWSDTGPTSASVFKALKQKYPTFETLTEGECWTLRDAAFEVAKSLNKNGDSGGGANAAHRSMPLALVPFLLKKHMDDADLANMAREESQLTHNSEHSMEVCAANVVLCHHLIHGDTLEESLECATLVVDSSMQSLLEDNIESAADLNVGGFSKDALQAAIYFVKKGKGFPSTLVPSVKFAGAANYCPVLVGGIAGALYGQHSISEKHLEHWSKDELVAIHAYIDKVISFLK